MQVIQKDTTTMGITVADVVARIAAAAPKIDGRPLTTKTLDSYGSRIGVVAKGMGKEKDVRSLLSDYNAVDAWVDAKGWAKATYVLTYIALYRAAQVLGLTEAADHYNSKMLSYSKENIEATKLNKGKESIRTATGGRATLPLSDLRAKVRAMNSYDADHALLALYILMPPRRLEYRFLQYYSKAPITPEPSGVKDIRPANRPVEQRRDDNGIGWNYVYPKSSNMLRIVLRYHKNSGVQGVYSVDLPPEVSAILARYIKEENIVKEGDDLFIRPKSEKPYTGPAFSSLMTSVLKSLTGIPKLSVDDLRHAAATDIRNDNTASYADKEELARAMGHSVNIADIVYNKVATPPPAPSVPTVATPGPSSSSKGKGKGKGKGAPVSREEFDDMLERLVKVENALRAMGVSL